MQLELKAPKSRNNRFGGYNYRNTEDIFTAVKPLLDKYKLTLMITDRLELIGERYYVKATAILIDAEEPIGELKVTAYAREQLERKKSDASQLTGAASSYARKYALNGLFLIDDAADADSYEDDPDDVLDAQEAEEQKRDEDEKNPFMGPYNKETGLYDPDAEEDAEEEPDTEEEESRPVTRRRRKRRD